MHTSEIITLGQIEQVQKDWARGVIHLGSYKDHPAKSRQAAELFIDRFYAYGLTQVLFKPTKALSAPFRTTRRGALSYFIGDDSDFFEDSGFALQPWHSIQFHNAAVRMDGATAAAMGHYQFIDSTGDSIQVEYSLAYLRDINGNLRIWLHHSSLPFSG